MSLRVPAAAPAFDLPSIYRLVALREAGDAFAHACVVAGDKGAGTLVWVRRFDVAEFALVLEPEDLLKIARRAFHAGMNALADALAAHAPPERPIAFDWPDAIRIDGVLVGGGRLGWPAEALEAEVPSWLVFGGMIRTAIMRAGEPGLRPLLGSLDEVGFEAIDAGAIMASFARHLMAGLHEWNEDGFEAVAKKWLSWMPVDGGKRVSLAENGDLLFIKDDGRQSTERKSLAAALATPSWRDPATGMPWL